MWKGINEASHREVLLDLIAYEEKRCCVYQGLLDNIDSPCEYDNGTEWRELLDQERQKFTTDELENLYDVHCIIADRFESLAV